MMAKKYESIVISKSKELRDFDGFLKQQEKRKLVLVLAGELIGELNLKYKLSTDSSLELFIVMLLSGKSNLHVNYVANHLGRKSKSKFESYCMLDDEASKSLSMRIVFKRGSLDAEGSEKERTMLLSEKCHNNSLPIIESFEESAHGVHGTSTGHLDINQMKLLGARGIKPERARSLLIYSGLLNFCNAINDRDIVKYILRKVKNESR